MIKVKILPNKICVCYYKKNLLYSMYTGESLGYIYNSLQGDLKAMCDKVIYIQDGLERNYYRQGISVLKDFIEDIEISNIL